VTKIVPRCIRASVRGGGSQNSFTLNQEVEVNAAVAAAAAVAQEEEELVGNDQDFSQYGEVGEEEQGQKEDVRNVQTTVLVSFLSDSLTLLSFI